MIFALEVLDPYQMEVHTALGIPPLAAWTEASADARSRRMLGRLARAALVAATAARREGRAGDPVIAWRAG
jgi:hypothetical protein